MPEYICEISASIWFYYKEIFKMHSHTNIKNNVTRTLDNLRDL